MIHEILSRYFASSPKQYLVGVAIYAKFGESEFLKKLFTLGENQTSKAKLNEELQKLLDQAPVTVEESPQEGKAVAGQFRMLATPKHTPIDAAKLTPRLRTLNEIRISLFKEMSYRHAAMCALPEEDRYNQERKEHLERIDELDEYCIWIFSELDYFQAKGAELPMEQQLSINKAMMIQVGQHKQKKEVPLQKLTEADLLSKKASLQSSRARFRKQGKTQQVEEYTQLIEAVVNQLHNVRS
jgi:hypothetical protein